MNRYEIIIRMLHKIIITGLKMLIINIEFINEIKLIK